MVKRTKSTVKSTEVPAAAAVEPQEMEIQPSPSTTQLEETPEKVEVAGSSVDESAGPRPKKRSRRQVDFSEMMGSYRKRMIDTDLTPLANTWLTDFNLHDIDLSASPPVHHAKVLLELCKERKIPVRGVVSCNKKNNVYVQRLPDNLLRCDEGGSERVTYIGSQNKFTNLDASPFSPIREDAVKVIPPAVYAKDVI